MIVNIRGTSGAGKSTVVREIMGQAVAIGYVTHVLERPRPPSGRATPIAGYRLHSPDTTIAPIYIVGSYVTACGGCDALPTQDEICDRVREYAAAGGHVVFEGLLISGLFSRYAALARELAPTPYIWAFLDTPIALCLERVGERRRAAGNVKPLNPANTEGKAKAASTCYEKARAAGLDARWVAWQTAGKEIWSWLIK